MATKAQYVFFRESLMRWHREQNDRSLPWKGERDAYRIWLSEIILQQTRAAQGLDYYLKFTRTYPDIRSLAAAPDEEVFRLWQGLGYYNRCRNMLATARFISDTYQGRFPDTYEEILALKGVGPYTAAAIASFAFDLPHAVVDGNVYRVLSRFFAIETPVDSTEGKRIFASLAQELIDVDSPAAYNQAIMDLGATVCTPAAPLCMFCPLAERCAARRQDMTGLLPVKEKKLSVQTRHFNYVVMRSGNSVWIRQRKEKGIWQDLHEFLLVETPEAATVRAVEQHINRLTTAHVSMQHMGSLRQRLTHQLILSEFYEVQLPAQLTVPDTDGFWVEVSELQRFAFPKTMVSFIAAHLHG
ncbi:MAG: A/G-specific adenine glycosylase [Chitinophagaceae bacterium]